MKYKIILALVFLLFAVSFVGAYSNNNLSTVITSSCFQETANFTNVLDGNCNQAYTGKYASSGTIIQMNNIFDGNYSTLGGLFDTSSAFLVNYTVPSYSSVNNITWEFNSNATLGDKYNITIPIGAIFDNKIVLNVSCSAGSCTNYNYSYLNSTGNWNTIATGISEDIYEEAIAWNVLSYKIVIQGGYAYTNSGSIINLGKSNDTVWTTNSAGSGTIFINYTTMSTNAAVTFLQDGVPVSLSCYNGTGYGVISGSNVGGTATVQVPSICLTGTKTSFSYPASSSPSSRLYESNITFYGNSFTAENLTFNLTSPITRYLAIPQGTILTNAFMNLSGFGNSSGVSSNTTVTTVATSYTFPNTATDTNSYGAKIHTKYPAKLYGFNISTAGDCTNAILLNSSGATVMNVTFVNKEAIFDNFTLLNNTNYTLITNGKGASCSAKFNGAQSPLVTGDNFDIITGINAGADDAGRSFQITTISTLRNLGGGAGSDNRSTNPSVIVGNTNVWNYTGIFNQTNNRTDNFATAINNYCVSILGTCSVPFYFGATINNGTLQYSDLSFTDNGFLTNNIIYNTPINSGGLTNITLNISTSQTPTAAILTYNGTNSFPSISTDGTNYIINSLVNAPIFSSQTNISFFYTITINGINYTSSVYQQTINPINISLSCGAGTFPFINITNYDEDTLINLTGTVEYNLFLNNNGVTIAEINGTSTGQNLSLCTSVNLTTIASTYSLQLRYYTTNYMVETYNILDNNASLVPISIPLYFLANATGTAFLINYVDFNYLIHPGALIQMQRQYIPQNVYNVVEIPLIANDGTAKGAFNTANIKYKIIIVENGEIIDIFDDIFPVCQNVILGTCNVNLRGAQTTNVQNETDFAYNLQIVNNTIVLTYVIPSGTPKSVNFLTVQNSRFINAISSCNSTIFASGGTINCGYNDTVGDSLISTEIDIDGVPTLFGTIRIAEDLAPFFLGNNYFIAFVLMLTLVLIFVGSAPIQLVVGAGGIVYLGLVFLIKGASIGLLAGSLGWLIVVISLAIYKISQKEDKYS